MKKKAAERYKRTDKLPTVIQGNNNIIVKENKNSVSNNQNKIDVGLKSIHDAQAEYDRRTKAELEAISLVAEGRHEDERSVLDAMDDKVMKDFLEE